MSSGYRWGIDLGGTKIEAVILDPATGEEIYRKRVPTEREQGYEHILSQVELVISEVEEASGQSRPARIGLGMPGITDPVTGRHKNANVLEVNGRSFQQDITARLCVEEVIVANDANCFALAEATMGAAQGHAAVFGIVIGSGVGGGWVVNGQVLAGRHGVAGEWGHNVLDPEGEPCPNCGKHGCVESVIAGPSLERFYEAQSGIHLPLAEIAERARTPGQDLHADATIERLTTGFARALAPILSAVDPDAIVIGGGVSNIEALYANRVREKIAERFFNDHFGTPILRPTLGDSAGVFGAAMLVETAVRVRGEGGLEAARRVAGHDAEPRLGERRIWQPD